MTCSPAGRPSRRWCIRTRRGNTTRCSPSYETEDAATWTYTVLEGMTWSDGVEVTAEDILYTLQYEDGNGAANFVSQTDEEGEVTEAKYSGYSISADGRSISLTLKSPNVRRAEQHDLLQGDAPARL